jgi:tRNA (guanine-N7-)-methyltransferase
VLVTATEFWAALFTNEGPVEVEIGSGDGAFLIASACERPAINFLGLERSPAKAKRLAQRLVALNAPNVRVLQADATCVIGSLLPVASVEAYHVYFPDPWPKRGHAARRIFHPTLVAGVARTLRAGGLLHLATDVVGYAAVARALVVAHPTFREIPAGADHPGYTTSFARKYRAVGRPLHVFTFERIGASDCDQALAASKMRSM